jgi:hypothetical protein
MNRIPFDTCALALCAVLTAAGASAQPSVDTRTLQPGVQPAAVREDVVLQASATARPTSSSRP